MLIWLLLLGPLIAADANSLSRAEILFYHGHYHQSQQLLIDFVRQEPGAAHGSRALYLLATIHEAQQRPAEAVNRLEELLHRYPSSPWAPGACARLADHAAARGERDRERGLIERFLELYLADSNATLDDRVCGRMYDRLAKATAARGNGAGTPAVGELLKSLYPEESAAGRVVAYWTPPNVADPKANLVLNPGFELDGRDVPVPVGWSCIGSEPNFQDDLDGVFMAGVPSPIVQPHSGRSCAGKFSGHGKHLGWLRQRVPVTSGARYEVTAHAFTPISKDYPARLRLGVDPDGGFDPEAPSVRWTSPVSPTGGYERIGFEQATAILASGDRLTLFLEVHQEVPADPNAMLWDDVAVRRAPD
ncbi:MAG: hypothetical protein AMXMBFR13_27330 [Phycisphaerae bacterium]